MYGCYIRMQQKEELENYFTDLKCILDDHNQPEKSIMLMSPECQSRAPYVVREFQGKDP